MKRSLLYSLLGASTLILPANGVAQTCSWSNNLGGFWHDSANWAGGVRPNATTTAASVFINTAPHLVPGMSLATPTQMIGQYSVGTIQSANPLIMFSNGTSLTINGNGSVIHGQLTGQNYAAIIGPGNLLLNGGLFGNGLQINLAGGVTVNGTSKFFVGLQMGAATFNGTTTANWALVGLENPATPRLLIQ